MNSKTIRQTFKTVLYLQGIVTLLLPVTGRASALDIKDTNYPISSGAYFVASDGKNTNSGRAPNSSWSVTQALKSAPSGATIVFRGGTYRDVNNLGITKRLTLQAYRTKKPGSRVALSSQVGPEMVELGARTAGRTHFLLLGI